MEEYGMKPVDVLITVNSENARMFHLNTLGELKNGFLADIIAIIGNPIDNISVLKEVSFVMKDGIIYKD